jgi:hypothetical protein
MERYAAGMVQVSVATMARTRSPEPQILAGGLAVLAAAEVLPFFWSRGVSPLPECFFHQVTGQPCPFCGGTRCFVAMAHGDLPLALQLYPIGPLLFTGLLLAVLYSAFALVTGKRVRLRYDRRTANLVIAVTVLALALNWSAKLLFLGYGPSPIAR